MQNFIKNVSKKVDKKNFCAIKKELNSIFMS